MAPSVTINTSDASDVTTITLNPPTCEHTSLLVDVEGFVDHGYCKSTPHVDVYYALFGTGPIKVILLMGIATSGLAWKHNIEYFVQNPQYQVCAVDNRGSGRTKTPFGRLTTSDMAQDVVALIKHLGWDQIKVHLVGNSLGGMIAQEVAIAIPDQLYSLTLIATHAGGWMTKIPPVKAMINMGKQFFARDDRQQAELVLETVFSKEHLKKPGRRSSLSVIKEEHPTVLDFYHSHISSSFSNLFVKEKTVLMFLQQLSAVLTHYVDEKRLEPIRDKFSSMVITGTGDKIVDSSHSYWLAKALNSELVKFEGAGHAVSEECLDDVNLAMHRHFHKSMSVKC